LRLYHGSNVLVEEPRLLHVNKSSDFGRGFYLTSSREQAARWAELQSKRRKEGIPMVSIFEIDDAELLDLTVLEYKQADNDWLQMITKNRKNIIYEEKFDIIVGPVADDFTMDVLNLYFSGRYSEEEALKRLLPQKLKDQYVFKTEEAIKRLEFVGGEKA